MADNTELDPGTGGDTIATDDCAGVKYERVKLTDGTADSTTVIASGGGTETNALRVTLANNSTGVVSVDDNGGSITVDGPLTDTELRASAIDVDGSGVTQPVSAASLPLPTGAATAAKQPALGTAGSSSTDVLSVQGIASGTALPVSLASVPSHAVTNAGTFAVQDSEKVADDAAFTVGTTKVTPVGYLADQASTDSVNEGDVGAARMTLDRKQIVTLAPSPDTEGVDVANNVDVDESEDAVKASAGKLYGWFWYNDGAAEVYIKYYNATTANVTVGTTTPVLTIGIPPGSASNIEWSHGIAFSTAITVAATTGAADSDTGAPAANQVVGFSLYK